MESYDFLLFIALILISTKLLGLATKRVHLPQVIGALVAGIILGPSGFGVLQDTDFIIKTAEIGVIMLMFLAGLDTDFGELKSVGLMAFAIACVGVLLPLVFCAGTYFLFFEDSFTYTNVLTATFIGTIFAATSVSITVETLVEMGKLKTKVGTTLIGAAIIDDIIGIVLLSVISGLGEGSSSTAGVGMVLVKIVGFFIFTGVVGFIVHKIFEKLDSNYGKSRRVAVWALAFCFLMSYIAEEYFSVADITGAYFAGLILCNITKTKEYVAKKVTYSSYLFFTPIFFASIGIKTDISGVTPSILVFALVMLIVAIATKVIGCGVTAKLFKMSTQQSLGVGVGMISRGEVALMMAQKGMVLGFVSASVFPSIILVVVGTVLITPVLLNFAMKNYEEKPAVAKSGA